MKLNYRMAFINDEKRLRTLSERLRSVSALAVDIETVNWWHPPTEQVALIQVAYRANNELRVAVVDTLAQLDPTILRRPLELDTATKVMHNAVFDAVRLARHFKINSTPIHDTLLAARRSGEKRYSLKAQVEKYLNLPLDKKAQQSDWSLRPLQPAQIDYAARDAVATLLLYEHQTSRGLNGEYRLRAAVADEQDALPLGGSLHDSPIEKHTPAEERPSASAQLSNSSLALLGIITELPSRYYPEQLAVSVGDDRVGLAGWIIDRILGQDADLDESSVRIEIASLCQSGLVRISPTRRLEANESGKVVWQKHKPL